MTDTPRIPQRPRLSDIYRELFRTGGRWTRDITCNSGEEFDVAWIDAPPDSSEPWVRLSDSVASSWVGPYSVALARLEMLPDEDEEQGGWQRIWNRFPEEEYTLEEND
jgi:hypothetical protein